MKVRAYNQGIYNAADGNHFMIDYKRTTHDKVIALFDELKEHFAGKVVRERVNNIQTNLLKLKALQVLGAYRKSLAELKVYEDKEST